MRQLTDPAAGAGQADTELLQRFVRQRDHAAFELLVWRHGPMVLGACRRLLCNPHDAEDAFQATWLVLVRKAGSISRGASLGAWLHRVACRVALRLRAARARRASRQRPAAEQLAAPTFSPEGREVMHILDEEVNRLPARQRKAFVLCCLEGKTGQEAAQQMGCPAGTVSSRLTRAREILRCRLARRGLAPAGAGLALLAGDVAAAPLSAPEVACALQAAVLFSAGEAEGALSCRAVSLADGVLRTMFLTKLQMSVLALLVAGALAAGSVLAFHVPQDQQPFNPVVRENPPAPLQEPVAAAKKELPLVRVVKPRVLERERTAQFGTAVQAFEQADLFSPIAGVVKAVNVDLGARVKQGDVLVEIDAPLAVLEVRQASAAVRQARGKVAEAAARVKGARAEVNAAAENRAAVEVKKSKVTQAEAEVTTARANLEIAEVALQKADLVLGFTRIQAPFAGIVTRRTVWAGDFARVADQRGGQPLLTVQRVDRIRLVIEVPQPDIPYVEPGMKAEVTFEALRGFRLAATVSRIAFAQDPNNHKMRAEIDIPNPQGLLRPGMSGGRVSIQLPKGSKKRLFIPTSALFKAEPNWVGPSGPGERGAVFVVEDGKATIRVVSVEATSRNDAEILSGDLWPDELVVTNPQVVPKELGKHGFIPPPVRVQDRPAPK
jgi:RND family efflux transporter MFP subunit